MLSQFVWVVSWCHPYAIVQSPQSSKETPAEASHMTRQALASWREVTGDGAAYFTEQILRSCLLPLFGDGFQERSTVDYVIYLDAMFPLSWHRFNSRLFWPCQWAGGLLVLKAHQIQFSVFQYCLETAMSSKMYGQHSLFHDSYMLRRMRRLDSFRHSIEIPITR